MNPIRSANLGLRFGLELCALAALASGGYAAASTKWQQLALAVVFPAVGVTLWGMFVSPKARVSAHWLVRLAVEVVVFGVAAGLLYSGGKHRLAVVFAVVAIASRAVKAWFEVRDDESP
jgi:hypothetical protein